jgi:hypothetical protein
MRRVPCWAEGLRSVSFWPKTTDCPPVDAKRTFDPRQVLDQEASVLNLDGATPFQRLKARVKWAGSL